MAWVSLAELKGHRTTHTWQVYIQHKSAIIAQARANTLNEAKRAAYAKLTEKKG